jgi:hypothetical protein
MMQVFPIKCENKFFLPLGRVGGEGDSAKIKGGTGKKQAI